jgi:hypothetical protein
MLLRFLVSLLVMAMPDITLPPVLIDTGGVQFSAQRSAFFHNPYFQGPYVVGQNLYVVLQATQAPVTMTVFKSTDGGNTWAQQDAANAPAFTGSFQTRATARLSPDGFTLVIAFNPTASSNPTVVRFATFDCSGAPGDGHTDTYSFPYPDLSGNDASFGSGLRSFDMTVRQSGNPIVAWAKIIAPNTTQQDMGYQECIAGVWSAYVSVAAASEAGQFGWQVPALEVNPADGLLEWFVQRNHIGNEDDYYLNMTTGNVASVPALIRAADPNQRKAYGKPVVSAAQDAVFLPVFIQPGGGGAYIMRVYRGTPAAAPVFDAGTDLDAGPTAASLFDWSAGHVMTVGADVWAVWINWPAAGGTVLQLLRSINTAGVWGAVDVFYDMDSNPPNVLPSASQRIVGGCVGEIGAGGLLGGIISCNNFDNTRFEAYFLLQAVAPPVPAAPVVTISGALLCVRRRRCD